MLFNSIEFLIFFPIVTVLFFLLPHKWRWLHLLIASCIFYAAFIPIYILILFFTIIIDYIAGIMIEDAEGAKRKAYLVLSLIANIGVLAVFKYYNFFIDNLNFGFHWLGGTTNLPLLKMILPIGLSFHTFQAMSYTIEVYRGKQKAERHFGIYALYVMFYPQLVAGPIERPQNVLHQFHEEKHFNWDNLLGGLRLMAWGLFKKVVIADRLSIYVNEIYGHPEKFHYLNLIIATLFFTIQIYCDFSGYSDVAIGSAKTMGYDLMINFKRPYFSTNIQQFWSKWHISLSTWFRDYLYISLGGNRVSTFRRYLNVSAVFLVSGFWHGANWTFLVWGALHTLYIVIYMLYNEYSKIKIPDNFVANLLSGLFNFSIVALAWVFFRANTFKEGLLVIKNIFTLEASHAYKPYFVSGSSVFTASSMVIALFAIAVMAGIERKWSSTLYEMQNRPVYDLVFTTFAVLGIIVLGVFSQNSFIYFQF